MSKEYIKFSHFKKSLICQPFFIWNSLEENDGDSLESDTSGFGEEDFTEEFVSDSFSEILVRTYARFDEWLVDFISEESDVIILSSKSLEDKIEETKKYLDSGKVIIYPVFEYKGAICTPIAFDTSNSKIIDIKYSKKTKRSDFIKAYGNYSIINKSLEVNEYVLFLPADGIYVKGEIFLVAVECIHPQVAGDIPGATTAKGAVKNISIMETVASGKVTKDAIFPDIDRAIKTIKEAKKHEFGKSPVRYLGGDSTQGGTNPNGDSLLEVTGNIYHGINGNIIRKKDVIIEKEIESPIGDEITNADSAKIYNSAITDKLIGYIDSSSRVIGYDFEGFSLPFAPLNDIAPNAQVVFQVSVIETVDNVETMVDNMVVDPLGLTLDDLFKVIVRVYSDKADCYVVYNKAYENTRIREIVGYMEKSLHPKTEIAREMYHGIIENTIDLYEIFAISSKTAEPGVILHDQNAKASIKNVEKHITSNNIKLPRPITPYKELDVQNGMMAMNLAIERALGILGNAKGSEKVTMLRKYCENDVRAMIMVYDFVKMLEIQK